jgi:hypothetical protein
MKTNVKVPEPDMIFVDHPDCWTAESMSAYGDARAAEIEQMWKTSLLDACTVAWVNLDCLDPSEAIHRLISAEVEIALDPRASSEARDPQDKTRKQIFEELNVAQTNSTELDAAEKKDAR